MGVVGCLGYTGLELIRILVRHPGVLIKVVTLREPLQRFRDDKVFTMFPELSSCRVSTIEDADFRDCSVVFFATPHGIAMKWAPKLLSIGVRVIDLSADFRFKNKETFEGFYGLKHHSPKLLHESVYGLPEINRDKLTNANLVAMPGCYPTAVILGLLPLLERNIIEEDNVIADCKSGISGAGRSSKVSSLFGEPYESFKAYGTNGHRHKPEICEVAQTIIEKNKIRSDNQNLKTQFDIIFIPHLIPMFRGIFATLYVKLKSDSYIDKLTKIYTDKYKKEKFIKLLEGDKVPNTSLVKGSNEVHISIVKVSKKKEGLGSSAVILVAEDNLVKGAAGQAVQVMNTMLNFEEEEGLKGLFWSP